MAQEKRTSDVHGFGIGVAHEEVGIVGLELDEGTLGQRDQAHIHIVSLCQTKKKKKEKKKTWSVRQTAYCFCVWWWGGEGK